MKKAVLILIVAITVLLSTSCWSRREIESLGFVLGLGISKHENGLYSVIAQVANPAVVVAEAPNQRAVYTILKSEGLTIFDALRNLSLVAGRRLYLAHIKAIVIEEAIAREGISEVVGFLLQDMEVRLEAKVFISKLPPEKILDTPNTLGAIPAMVLDIAAQNYGANSKIFVSDLHDTVEAVNNPVINYVTTLVEVIPGPTEFEMDIMKLTQIAVFDSDKLVDYLDYEEGQGFNLITNNYKNGLIAFEHPETKDRIVIEILESNTKITPQYTDGKVSFHIKLATSGNIAERIPHRERIEGLDVENIQKLLDQILLDKLNKTVSTAQKKLHVDIFNLSGDFYRKYPKEFQNLKDDWNEVFSKADITIEVESTVIHSALNTHRGKL